MIVRTLAAWTVFVIVCITGLFTLLTHHKYRAVPKIGEFRPYAGASPDKHILRRE